MSEAAEVIEELEETVETEEPEAGELAEGETGETVATETEADEQDDDIVVVIDGEEEEEEKQEAPQWVKDLRKSHRELKREKRELEERLVKYNKPEKVALGEKPTLANCDFDSEVYEAKLADWYEKKRTIEKEAAEKEAEQENQQKAWQAKLTNYEEKKASLKVKDFDEAEDTVKDMLSVTQQGIIVQGANDPALVVLAIGSNPKKAKELAEITDPVQFAFAVARLETQLKVGKRKPPAPEKTITGTAKSGGAVDSHLERLRADAEKTGDYSKVVAYKRQKKNAAT